MMRCLLAGMMLLGFSQGMSGFAQADFLLDIQGTSYTNSSYNPTSGSATDLSGKFFDVQATFESTPYSTSGGILGQYHLTSLEATIGGTTYQASGLSGGYVYLEYYGLSGKAAYLVLLTQTGGFTTSFGTNYLQTTPTLNPIVAGPTVFSQVYSTGYNSLNLTTANGFVILNYDPSVGPSSESIRNTPEPSAVALLGMGLVCMITGFTYRRRSMARVVV